MPLSLKLSLLSLLCLVPAALLGHAFLTDGLGANPLETLEHNSGNWALIFLLLTLAISPLQYALAMRWPIPSHLVRRILGLSAFFYALLHLSFYFVFEMGMNLEETFEDIATRPFILIGMLALLLLLPLAITSTQKWQRRLKQHWKSLHQLIYPITFLAILHYGLLVKADYFWPAIYFLLFVLLMLPRWIKRAKTALR
ncbi:MAG: sulfoxide reductase heme-binding subunit YedZ [Thiotrichales bacterium]|nr:sulfoxide reductase heme-binding subunit YedZ [Thiotrichales bacterium]